MEARDGVDQIRPVDCSQCTVVHKYSAHVAHTHTHTRIARYFWQPTWGGQTCNSKEAAYRGVLSARGMLAMGAVTGLVGGWMVLLCLGSWLHDNLNKNHLII